MIYFRFIVLVLMGCLITACSNDRWEAETEKVSYEVSIGRLDKAVFALNGAYSASEWESLQNQFGPFLNYYTRDIMQIGRADNPMTPPLLSRFTEDVVWKDLQSKIVQVHPELDRESQVLEEAFKRYAVFFATDSLPNIVAYNSGFNIGIYPTVEWLGIGLEWYSGSDLEILDQLPPDLFPLYKRNKMKTEYLTINAIKGWLSVNHQSQISGSNLLAQMVFAGKILYTAQVMQEDVSEAVLLNYSEEQLEWCRNNEFDVWKFFLENDLLFSEDVAQMNKIMNDGPFTPGMPQESPGGVGNWIGYRMVKAYMNANESITLPQLMERANNREFLNYYKPGK